MSSTTNKDTSYPNVAAFNLTETELDILCHIKEGLTSPEIGAIRGCSSRTIEKHRSNIIQKIGVKSSQNALLMWIYNNPNFLNT